MRTISKVAYVDYDNFYVAELEKIRKKRKMKQIKKIIIINIVLLSL